ncbi:MAG: hypothetical protein EZS28_003173 [Streblomastix strix]|uniref:Uncharacterized protein n=1 Tax=Streblomastix strix TaxID=222440 RepID=A0A5J4X3R3_9EUKA|nr:MAG: hypothetical protein EZS28_003173 [Streblomastix strix]
MRETLLSLETENYQQYMNLTKAECLARFELIDRVWRCVSSVLDDMDTLEREKRNKEKEKEKEKEKDKNENNEVNPNSNELNKKTDPSKTPIPIPTSNPQSSSDQSSQNRLMLFVYGSFSSYLSLPMSDVDLVVVTVQTVDIRICPICGSFLFRKRCECQPRIALKQERQYHSNAVIEIKQKRIIVKKEKDLRKEKQILKDKDKDKSTNSIGRTSTVPSSLHSSPYQSSSSSSSSPSLSLSSIEAKAVMFAGIEALLSLQLTPTLQHLLDFSKPLISAATPIDTVDRDIQFSSLREVNDKDEKKGEKIGENDNETEIKGNKKSSKWLKNLLKSILNRNNKKTQKELEE